MRSFKLKAEKSLDKVEKWVESHGYKGYEPFDGLSSVFSSLIFKNGFAERLLQQMVRQSPINLRPLLGIKAQDSTKGRAYMVRGYLSRYQQTSQEDYKRKAAECLDWLMQNKSPHYPEYTWGNHFDYASRAFRLPKQEPTIVWTSLIGQSFLDAYELLKEVQYLEIAESIVQWILRLPREKTSSGTCLSYVAFAQRSIHNANMLGAAMLARTAQYIQNDDALNLAREAMDYSCSSQLPNGAWYYGQESKYHWIDNFHTGYNLDSLKCYIENSGESSLMEHLKRGLAFFMDAFFEKNGRPNYYHDRGYPLDIQCASQAIDTLVHFSDYEPSCLPLAQQVADWTIDNMQDKSGYFYYRILPAKKVKIPMIHWGQCTMYRALAALLKKLE